MELEIHPEPSAEERAAILTALEELRRGADSGPYRSAWRAEGIRENTDGETDAPRLLHDGPAA